MSRNAYEMIFTLALLLVVGAAVWQAQGWQIKARLFPWAIGLPLMGLLAALLVTQVMRQLRASSAVAAEQSVAVEHPEETADPVRAADARRRGFTIVGWLLGFLAAVWLLGFPVGGTLGTLAYLKLAAREKWPISGAISAGTALFFAVMIYGLNTPFPRGALLELFGA